MATNEARIHALKSLIKVLTSALKIVKQTHYTTPPMAGYTPDKTRGVVETALICADTVDTL